MNRNNAKIKIIGVGGAGCNAVNHMIEEAIKGVEFYGLNTDIQSLDGTEIQNKIQIGQKLTNGLGAGAEPSVGRESAEEDPELIKHILEGCDMVFITAGMGGGTGTGAAPVVAKYAKEMGILTVAVVTKPFNFENRDEYAEQGIEELKQYIDSLIVIPNEKLLPTLGAHVTALEAFAESDNVLLKSIKGIAELITNPGVINVDFADVKRVMKSSGIAMMGMGIASGENRVEEAISRALNSELLECSSIKGAKGILINVSGNMDLPLGEFQAVGKRVREFAHKDARIITGMTLNHEINDKIIITIVATNLNPDNQNDFIEEMDEINPMPFIQNKFRETINSLNLDENKTIKLFKDNEDLNKEDILFKTTENKRDILTKNKKEEKDEQWDLPSFLRKKDS